MQIPGGSVDRHAGANEIERLRSRAVAQPVAHGAGNPEAAGSSPACSRSRSQTALQDVPPRKFHTVPEIAAEWNLSPQTVYRLFDCEPGVFRMRSRKGYTTWRIPPEVLRRVEARLTGLPFGVAPEQLERAV